MTNYRMQSDSWSSDSDVQRNNLPYSNLIQPEFNGFQLIGDSLLVRFADKILNQPNRIVNGSKALGYCVSGQRIDQLRQKIKLKSYPLTSKIMILIGTNDILCGGEFETMKKHFNRLLKILTNSVDHILILTLPPIPKLSVTYYHWTTIRLYNNYLKGLDNGVNIIVADVCPIFTKFTGALEFSIAPTPMTARTSLKKTIIVKKEMEPVKRSLKPDELKKQKLLSKVRRHKESKGKRRSQDLHNGSLLKRKLMKIKNDDTSESDYKNTSDTNTSPDSENISSDVTPDMDVKPVETPVLKKGIKRKFRSDGNIELSDNSDDDLLPDGDHSSKYRKVELEETDDPLCPSPQPDKLPRNSKARAGLNTTPAGLFVRTIRDVFAKIKTKVTECPKIRETKQNENRETKKETQTEDLLNEKSEEIEKPEQKLELDFKKTNIKAESRKSRIEMDPCQCTVKTEHLSATDSWNVETDEELMENHVYISQEDVSYDLNETENEDSKKNRGEFIEYIDSMNRDDLKKVSHRKKVTLKNIKNEETDDSESSATSDDQTSKRQITPYIDNGFVTLMRNSANDYMRFNMSNLRRHSLDSPLYRSYEYLNSEFYGSPLTCPPEVMRFAFTPPPPPPPMPHSPLFKCRNRQRSSSYDQSMSSLDGLPDVTRNIIELSNDICYLEYYEMFYSFGNKRIDMIHLNYRGLDRIKRFLLENSFL